MRFFASWWERIPVRAAVPTLVAVLAFAGGVSGFSHYAKSILSFTWS
jgi:hypothetical protein